MEKKERRLARQSKASASHEHSEKVTPANSSDLEEDEEDDLSQRKTNRKRGEVQDTTKREKHRDMYKLMDGSALMAIGTLSSWKFFMS